MSTVERNAIRLAGYTSYVAGVAGTGLYLGSPWGWVLLAAAGAIPGGYLLRQDVERRGVDRDRERLGVGRQNGRPTGPAPEPLGTVPPEVPPAF